MDVNSNIIIHYKQNLINLCFIHARYIHRCSHPMVFLEKRILEICSKFTGEHPCRSVISIKLPSNFIEITLRHGCSSVNLWHIFRIPFTKNASGWLLLYTAHAFLLPGKEFIDCFLLDTWLKGIWMVFIFFFGLLVCFILRISGFFQPTMVDWLTFQDANFVHLIFLYP